jgi:hypothetical protein
MIACGVRSAPLSLTIIGGRTRRSAIRSNSRAMRPDSLL